MRLLLAVILITLWGTVLYAAPVHEFHTTFTTIEHDRETNNLEITIKIFTHDLVPTLEKRLKRNIDLGATEGLDNEILSYITERFSLKTADGKTLQMNWVGKEVEAQVVLVYLEIPFDGNLKDATVSNSMFFERYKEQVNYVSLKFGETKRDLVFKVGDLELKTEN